MLPPVIQLFHWNTTGTADPTTAGAIRHPRLVARALNLCLAALSAVGLTEALRV